MDYYSLQSQASPTGSRWLQQDGHSQSATMQDWLHAFPRPRHTRVMKPRSAGNSPSSTGRRRTTVAQSVMHGPPTQYQSSLEAALLASAVRNERPISWHPSSARGRGLSNPACAPDLAGVNYANMATLPNEPMNGLPVYGSDTMLSYPISTDPSYSPGYYPVYSDVQDTMSLQQTPMSMPGSQVEPMNWDITGTNADFSTMTQTTSDGWSLDMLPMANIPPAETTCPSYASVPSPGELSGPSTPDFLPIQQFDDEPDLQDMDGKDEEELVGMGLYSQPDGSLGQRHQGALGKGLKLEETFSPSEEDKDEGSADGSEIGDLVEPVQQQTAPDEIRPMTQQSTWSIPKQPSKQALNLLHKSFFFDHDDLDQQAMTAAQPFASLNQPCMSYGYGWI